MRSMRGHVSALARADAHERMARASRFGEVSAALAERRLRRLAEQSGRAVYTTLEPTRVAGPASAAMPAARPAFTRVFRAEGRRGRESRQELLDVLGIIAKDAPSWSRTELDARNKWPHVRNVRSFTPGQVESIVSAHANSAACDVVVVGDSPAEPTAIVLLDRAMLGSKFAVYVDAGWDERCACVEYVIARRAAPVGHATFAMRLALRAALEDGKDFVLVSAFVSSVLWYMNSIGVPAAILPFPDGSSECFERSKAYSMSAGDDLVSIFGECIGKRDSLVTVLFALRGRAAMSALDPTTLSAPPAAADGSEASREGRYVRMFAVDTESPLVVGHSYDIASGPDGRSPIPQDVRGYVSVVTGEGGRSDCGPVHFAGEFLGLVGPGRVKSERPDSNSARKAGASLSLLLPGDLTASGKYAGWFAQRDPGYAPKYALYGHDEWGIGQRAAFSNGPMGAVVLVEYDAGNVLRRSYPAEPSNEHRDTRTVQVRELPMARGRAA
jgi:hypothetical protein